MSSPHCGPPSPTSRTTSQAGRATAWSSAPRSPKSNWPGLPGGLDQQSTSGVAGSIATNAGAIGAVQVKYATDLGFGPSNPAQGCGVGEERQRASTPSPPRWTWPRPWRTPPSRPTAPTSSTSAGSGPMSTTRRPTATCWPRRPGRTPPWGPYSAGSSTTRSPWANRPSPSFGYASLGLSLEKYGVDQVERHVPGAVGPTAAEEGPTPVATSPRPRCRPARPRRPAACSIPPTTQQQLPRQRRPPPTWPGPAGPAGRPRQERWQRGRIRWGQRRGVPLRWHWAGLHR